MKNKGSFFLIVSAIASLIAIFIFFSGKKNIQEVIHSIDSEEESIDSIDFSTYTDIFGPEDVDIYVNKVTHEAFVFHGIKLDYNKMAFVEFYYDDSRMLIVNKDGSKRNLGVKIQWLVKPHMAKANEIQIVRTRDGESVEGKMLPLVLLRKDEYKIGDKK